MNGSSVDPDEWLEQKARTLGSDRPVSVEVYLRSFAPPIGARERQEEIVSKLRELEERGRLETVEVTVWGDAVCPDGCCAETHTGREILNRMKELQQWGNDEPCTVERTFEEKHVTSAVTDEAFKKIIPPRITLGVYSRGDIRLVLPCRIGDETVCVNDFLEALERTEPMQQSTASSSQADTPLSNRSDIGSSSSTEDAAESPPERVE